MRKRVHIAFGVLLVILAGVIGWQVLRLPEREPVYQSKRLGFWLESLCKTMTQGNQDDRDRTRQAIQHIGTNALPVLVERLRAQDTRLKELLMTWAEKQRLVHFHFKSANQRRIESVLGYSALGQLATPSLSDTLTNDPFPCARRAAASALGLIGPKAKLAAPALFRATKDSDDAVRIFAFGALGRIQPDPKLTTPVLMAGLDDPSTNVRRAAAMALGNIGPEARLAAPALFRATKDTDDAVCIFAFGALGRIQPDPRLTIPVLVAGLNARFPLTRCSAATALGEYGPEARPAVPALLRMLATNGVPGIEYVTAVSALKKIDPEAAVKAGVKW
jgi:HEAT repeat protein